MIITELNKLSYLSFIICNPILSDSLNKKIKSSCLSRVWRLSKKNE